VVCLVVFSSSLVSAFNWSNGIVSYYKLDETSGGIAYDSVLASENDGTVSGATHSATGKIHTAYSFDGTNDRIIADTSATSSVSLAVWIKTSFSDTQRIIEKDSETTFTSLVFNEGGLQATIRDDSLTMVTTSTYSGYNDGNWHFIVLTEDGTNLKLYANGSLLETISSSSVGTQTMSDFNIGVMQGYRQHFDGLIDEVGIWSRALTSTEVTQLYNGGDGITYIDYGCPTVTAISPANESIISDVGTNFTAIFNITGTNANNYTWKNATYYVWKNGDLFNTTTISLSGNNTNYTQNIDNFTLADYKWDVLAYYGNLTFSNSTWSSNGNFTFSVGASIISETYENSTYETSEETFKVNINLLPGVVLQAAYLYYNNTKYIGEINDLGSNNYLMEKSIDIPLLNGATENEEFFWSFVYTSPIQKTQNTTKRNQSVSSIFFGLCNATYTTSALNVTIKEEGTFDVINGTLEFSADYWLGSGFIKKQLTYSYLINDTSNYNFCISPPNKTFNIDDIISYTATDYDRRDYFINDVSLSNVTMDLSLYLSKTATTDIFTFSIQDENSQEVEGAFINIQRWDIGTNNFYTVGMIKTTSDGTGIINLRLNDAWYRYQVFYEGILRKTTEPVKEAGSSRTIQIDLAAANPYLQFDEIDYSLTYDEDTNLSVFTFADTTGAINIACLKVLKVQGNGTTIVYNSCVQSSSGTLSYEIEGEGTYIIRAIFKLTSEYDSVEEVIDEIIRQGTPERFVIIGKFGQFISLLLVGTAAMLGIAVGSIPLGLGLIIFSLILVNLIGWLNITSSVLYALISITILIALSLKRGR